ncbi:MAG: L-threonylcarbamoyladenylate synthase [Candidatus Omnitrophota bacterium]
MKTEIIKIHPNYPEYDKIIECAKIIRDGGLVVFPTETVYGIAANAEDRKAVERLYKVKRRSLDKPFSILAWQKLAIDEMGYKTDRSVYKLIDEFWPGPLTVIVPTQDAGKTIGLRMPNNLIALSLAREAQCLVAAPSANFEGNHPPVTYAEALRDLDGLVDVAIDGGPSTVGHESAIVDLTNLPPKILRSGPISQADIDRITKQKIVLFVCTGNSCRSVMAEYLLRKKLEDRRDVKVISAGTGVYISTGASEETLCVLRKEGINALSHRAQPVTKILLKKADLIFVMTSSHRRQVLEFAPSVEDRIYLLREFAKNAKSLEETDISDPIGRSAQAYEECLEMIKDSIQKIGELV